LVREAVHLFLNDVGRFAGAFREQLLAFQDGRADLDVPVPRAELARGLFDQLPLLDFARQDVVRATDGWDHAVNNSYSNPRSASPIPGSRRPRRRSAAA